MNIATSRSALERLRAKTDQQLAVLLRREVKRGSSLVNQSRLCDAKRSYERAEALFALAPLTAAERLRLREQLDELREALSVRAMTAA